MEPSHNGTAEAAGESVDLSRATANASASLGSDGFTAGGSGPKAPKTGRKPRRKTVSEIHSPDIAPEILVPPERSTMPKETVEAAIRSLTRIIDESVQRAIGGAASRIHNDPAFIRDHKEKVAVTSDEETQFAKLGTEVCEQYGLLGKHAALMFLMVFAIGYITRIGLTTLSLNKLAETKKKLGMSTEEGKNELSTQESENPNRRG
jgi:hypothetical protein